MSIEDIERNIDNKTTEYIISQFSSQYSIIKQRAITIRFETYVENNLIEQAKSIVREYLNEVQSNCYFLHKFHEKDWALEMLVKHSNIYNFQFNENTIKCVEYFANHRHDVLTHKEIKLQLLRLGNENTIQYYDKIDFTDIISMPGCYSKNYHVCEYMTKRYGKLFILNNSSDCGKWHMLTDTVYIPIILKYITQDELYPLTDYNVVHMDSIGFLIDNFKYKLINVNGAIDFSGNCKGAKLLVCLVKNNIVDVNHLNQYNNTYYGYLEHAKKSIKACLEKPDYKSIINELVKFQQSDYWYCAYLVYRIWDETELLRKIISEIKNEIFEYKSGTYHETKEYLMQLYDQYNTYLHYRYDFNCCSNNDNDIFDTEKTNEYINNIFNKPCPLIKHILDGFSINAIKDKNYTELFDIIDCENSINELFRGEYLIMHAIKNKDIYLIDKLIEKKADSNVSVNNKNLKWYVQEYMNNDQNILRLLNLAPPSDIDALRKEIMILRDEITELKATIRSHENTILSLTTVNQQNYNIMV